MERFIWIFVFATIIGIQIARTNIAYALGQSLVWYAVALVVTVIVWAATKKHGPWQWFKWLNVSSYVFAGVVIAGAIILRVMAAKVGR